MDYVQYEFMGPRTQSTSLAVLEAGVNSMTTEWTYITTPPSPLQNLKGLPSSISLFAIDMTDELAVAKLMVSRRVRQRELVVIPYWEQIGATVFGRNFVLCYM